MQAEIFVGMDISQACDDLVVHSGTAFQIPYDERGIAHAVERLHILQPTVIVLEATGGLEVSPSDCRSWSSILGRSVSLPERPGSWRRPMRSRGPMPDARERFSLAGVRHIHAHNRCPFCHQGVSHVFTSSPQLSDG